MGRIRRAAGWVLTAALFSGLTAWVAVGQTAKRIDDNALKSGGNNKDEWITYGLDWAETRYSQLDQINDKNITKLGLAWSFDVPNIGDGARQESTNLVHNGVMYGITPWSLAYAIDLRTHKEKWRSNPEVDQQRTRGRICCGVVNRGLAIYENMVLVPAVDGRMRALEMETGKLIWEKQVASRDEMYSFTMAPRVIKGGRVIMGASGGEYAARGFFAALDVKTGKELWRFYTVPAPPDKTQEQPIYNEWIKTWAPEFWKHGLGGGGGVWNGMAYDPDTDLLYVASGQPGPWVSAHRGAGDNLCTDCIIAVKGETGKYVWHFQTTPGDDWDFDSIADLTLADITINGQLRKVLMHAPKNGFFYVLDRVTGKFIQGAPFVQVSWSTGLDPVTGRANVNPAARAAGPGTSGSNAIPGPSGGHVWQPQSFNPKTGLVYIPSTIGSGGTSSAAPTFTPNPTGMNMGTGGGGGGGRGRGAPAGGGGGPGAGGAPGAGAPAPAAPVAPGGARLAPDALNATFQTIAMQQAPPAPGGGAQGGRGGGAPGGRGGGAAGGRGGGAPGGGGGAPGAGGAPGGAGAPGGGAGGGGGQRGGGLPTIGPTGRGSIMIAWNPATMKEAWRGPSGSANGPFAGGSLATAGNLVISNSNNTMYVFKADTGEILLQMPTGFGSPGPPMTFMLDGKQYLVIQGNTTGAGAFGSLRPEEGPFTPLNNQPQFRNVSLATQGPPAGGAGAGGGGQRGGGGGGGGGQRGGGGAAGGGGRGAASGPQAPVGRILFLALDGKPVNGVASTAPEQ